MFAGPILVFGRSMKQDGEKLVRRENIQAAKAIAEVVRSCLGPRAMLKMLMDPMGGVVMTSDGNAILREIIVKHPTAKMMVEIARTQDEEVGDGTTSVIIICGQILTEIEKYIHEFHPVVIIRQLRQALNDILTQMALIGKVVNINNEEEVILLIKNCLTTKFLGRYVDLACKMALRAVNVVREADKCKNRMDFKNFARIEKVPGGLIEDSVVLEGVMINKDVLHHSMRKYIQNPRVLLLDAALDYRKGESQTNVEMRNEGDFTRLLQIEEEYVEKMSRLIIVANPDVVLTEKSISDLAIHYLAKAGITAIRRIKKMDNLRLARATGATILSRIEEINLRHIGTGAGLFEVKSIGDEYFAFFTQCKEPKACSIILRGPSKDILNEVERNLQDALNVVRNVYLEPRMVPGAGATEMKICQKLLKETEEELEDTPYGGVARALKIIPLSLLENTGEDAMKKMSELEAAYCRGEMLGVNGETGEVEDVEQLGVWDSARVKAQIYKTAVETAIHVIKIDEIVSGIKSKKPETEQVNRGEPTPTQESLKE